MHHAMEVGVGEAILAAGRGIGGDELIDHGAVEGKAGMPQPSSETGSRELGFPVVGIFSGAFAATGRQLGEEGPQVHRSACCIYGHAFHGAFGKRGDDKTSEERVSRGVIEKRWGFSKT